MGKVPPHGLHVSLKVKVGEFLGNEVGLGGRLKGKGGGKASREPEWGLGSGTKEQVARQTQWKLS